MTHCRMLVSAEMYHRFRQARGDWERSTGAVLPWRSVECKLRCQVWEFYQDIYNCSAWPLLRHQGAVKRCPRCCSKGHSCQLLCIYNNPLQQAALSSLHGAATAGLSLAPAAEGSLCRPAQGAAVALADSSTSQITLGMHWTSCHCRQQCHCTGCSQSFLCINAHLSCSSNMTTGHQPKIAGGSHFCGQTLHGQGTLS